MVLVRKKLAAGAGTARTLTGFEARLYSEKAVDQVHSHGSHGLHQILINQEFVALHIKHIVGFFRLVQSQGEFRAASARRHIYADGRGLLILKVLVQLIFCAIAQCKHSFLLDQTGRVVN